MDAKGATILGCRFVIRGSSSPYLNWLIEPLFEFLSWQKDRKIANTPAGFVLLNPQRVCPAFISIVKSLQLIRRFETSLARVPCLVPTASGFASARLIAP